MLGEVGWRASRVMVLCVYVNLLLNTTLNCLITRDRRRTRTAGTRVLARRVDRAGRDCRRRLTALGSNGSGRLDSTGSRCRRRLGGTGTNCRRRVTALGSRRTGRLGRAGTNCRRRVTALGGRRTGRLDSAGTSCRRQLAALHRGDTGRLAATGSRCRRRLDSTGRECRRRVGALGRRRTASLTRLGRSLTRRRGRLRRLVVRQFAATSRGRLGDQSRRLSTVGDRRLSGVLVPLRGGVARVGRTMRGDRGARARAASHLSRTVDCALGRASGLNGAASGLIDTLSRSGGCRNGFNRVRLHRLLRSVNFAHNVRFRRRIAVHSSTNRTIRRRRANDHLRPSIVVRFPRRHSVVVSTGASVGTFLECGSTALDSRRRRRTLRSRLATVGARIGSLMGGGCKQRCGGGNEILSFIIVFIPSRTTLRLTLTRRPAL